MLFAPPYLILTLSSSFDHYMNLNRSYLLLFFFSFFLSSLILFFSLKRQWWHWFWSVNRDGSIAVEEFSPPVAWHSLDRNVSNCSHSRRCFFSTIDFIFVPNLSLWNWIESTIFFWSYLNAMLARVIWNERCEFLFEFYSFNFLSLVPYIV